MTWLLRLLRRYKVTLTAFECDRKQLNWHLVSTKDDGAYCQFSDIANLEYACTIVERFRNQ